MVTEARRGRWKNIGGKGGLWRQGRGGASVERAGSRFLGTESFEDHCFGLYDLRLESFRRVDEILDVLDIKLEEHAADQLGLKCVALLNQREEELEEVGLGIRSRLCIVSNLGGLHAERVRRFDNLFRLLEYGCDCLC